MFPLQRSCELSFDTTDDKAAPQHLIPSDFIPYPNLVGCTDAPPTEPPAKPRRSRRMSDDGRRSCSGERETKKMVHREIERQRRQEMTSLFTSLRSLLPPQSAKGKRSMSDHIMETENYIKDLQTRVKEMEKKRDRLKRGSEDHSRLVVTVEKCSRGLEIKISCGSFDQGEGEGKGNFQLSRVLSILVQQGLDVVSCVSTKVSQGWIHVIHTEVNEVLSIDPNWLKWKLLNEITSTGSQ